jgi:hypothetical protein
VIVALRSGVAPEHWLDDPAALVTALELLARADADAARRR